MILGVLGGSGLYDLDGLSEPRTEEVSTPYGAPSAPIASGRIGSVRLLFLPRHGRGHRYSPSEINAGAAYEFSAYHLMKVKSPTELFPVHVENM